MILSSVPTNDPATGLTESEARSGSVSSVSSIYSQDDNHDAIAAHKIVPSTEIQCPEQFPEDAVLDSTTNVIQQASDVPLSKWLASTAPQGRPVRRNSKHVHYFENNGIKLRMKEHAGVLVEWVDGISLTMDLDKQLDPSRRTVLPDTHVDYYERASNPSSTWQRGGYKHRQLTSGASRFSPTSSRPVSLSKIDEVPLVSASSKDLTERQNVANDWGFPSSIERACLSDTVLEQLKNRSRSCATRHSSDYTMSGALAVSAVTSTTQSKDRPWSLPLTSIHVPMPLRVSTDPRTMSTPELSSRKKPVYEMTGSPVSPVSASTVPLSAQPDGFQMRPLSPSIASPPRKPSRALRVLRKFEHKPKFEDFVSKLKDREASVLTSHTAQVSLPAPARPQPQILSALRSNISHSLFEQSNPSKSSRTSRSEPHGVASPHLLPSPSQIRRMAQSKDAIYPSLNTSEIADLPHPARPPRQMVPATKSPRRPRSSTHASISKFKVRVESTTRGRSPTPPIPITDMSLKHQAEQHVANVPTPSPSLVSDYPYMATPMASVRRPASSNCTRSSTPPPSHGHQQQTKSRDSTKTTYTASTESNSTITGRHPPTHNGNPGSTDVKSSANQQDSSSSAIVVINTGMDSTHEEPFCACTDPEPSTTTSNSATLSRKSPASLDADTEPEPLAVEQGYTTTTNSNSTSRRSSPARKNAQSSDTLTNAVSNEDTTSTPVVTDASHDSTPTNISDDLQSHSTTSHEVTPLSPPTATVNTKPYRPIPANRNISYHDMTTGSEIVSPSSLDHYSTIRDQKHEDAGSNASYYALVTAKPHSSAVAVADMLRARSMKGDGSLRGRNLQVGRNVKVYATDGRERMGW